MGEMWKRRQCGYCLKIEAEFIAREVDWRRKG